MKKIWFLFLLMMVCAKVYAAPQRAVLIDSTPQEKAFGTSDNPISVSFSGDQVVNGSVSLSNHLTVTGNALFGTDTMYVDTTSGNVGVGTKTPSSLFYVNGSSPDSSYLVSIKNNTVGGELLQAINDTGNIVASINTSGTSDGFFFLKNASGATKVSLGGGDNSTSYFVGGNVGVGTTDPQEKLAISGNLSVSQDLTVNRDVYVEGSFNVIGSGDAYVLGNLGVGTSTPTQKLHVASNDPKILIEDTTGSPQTDYSISAAGGNFRIIDENSSLNLFTIDENDRFGFGVDNPSYKLDLTSSDVNVARFTGSGSAFGLILNNSTAIEDWQFQIDASGHIRIRDFTDNLAPFCIENTCPSNTLYMTTDGDVAIGKNTAGAKLDVLGDVKMSQDMTVSYTAGAYVSSFRGTTDTDITGWIMTNADGEVCYVYPNADQNGIVVSGTKP